MMQMAPPGGQRFVARGFRVEEGGLLENIVNICFV